MLTLHKFVITAIYLLHRHEEEDDDEVKKAHKSWIIIWKTKICTVKLPSEKHWEFLSDKLATMQIFLLHNIATGCYRKQQKFSHGYLLSLSNCYYAADILMSFLDGFTR